MDVVNTIAAQILALLELDKNTLFLVNSLEQIKERHENFIEESKHRVKQARAPHANPSDLEPARSQLCPRSDCKASPWRIVNGKR
jgi:hypothetical protein